MRLYATSPLRRTLQIGADLFVLVWVLAWVAIGRWVHSLVMMLASPADPLRSAGTSFSDRMTDVADQVAVSPWSVRTWTVRSSVRQGSVAT